MSEIFGTVVMSGASDASLYSERVIFSITDSSRPRVASESHDPFMFDWVVEPAGNGNFQSTSLL